MGFPLVHWTVGIHGLVRCQWSSVSSVVLEICGCLAGTFPWRNWGGLRERAAWQQKNLNFTPFCFQNYVVGCLRGLAPTPTPPQSRGEKKLAVLQPSHSWFLLGFRHWISSRDDPKADDRPWALKGSSRWTVRVSEDGDQNSSTAPARLESGALRTHRRCPAVGEVFGETGPAAWRSAVDPCSFERETNV